MHLAAAVAVAKKNQIGESEPLRCCSRSFGQSQGSD